MLLDFEVRNCSRSCAATERALGPGDTYFSVIQAEGADVVRLDYSAEAWEGPPEDSLGWWRSKVPTRDGSTPKLAPTDVMLNLFGTLADREADEEFRYLLGLLLMRRRVIRREDSFQNEAGKEVLLIFCPRRNERSELIVSEPNAEGAVLLQERMVELLYGDGEVAEMPANSTEE